MFNNILLNIDSYKASHYLQYPPHTQYVSSYIEARSNNPYDKLCFFGLQAFLLEYLCRPITQTQIDEAEELLRAHGLPFHRAGWQHILTKHAGYLPLQIDAIAEGTILPTQHVIAQIINTDPSCYWLTNYVETALLRAIWYPSTVCSISWHIKQILRKFLSQTADTDDAGLAFKLHDFGARGASSLETAALGGLAHLVHFQGTDNVASLLAARNYYQTHMAGFSIPAAEHSTITSWGREGEADAYRTMLENFAGDGRMVAVVSDSYDLWHALEHIWGGSLKSQVIHCGGTLVIRPDSGDPVNVVCQTLEKLMAIFGYHTNRKGYRVLPDFLRVIQGDGISARSISAILLAMQTQGLSAENIAFGMGAELLQKVNRDTLTFAMKASAANIDGHWQDVYKAPVTDDKKTSKRGRLALVQSAPYHYTTLRLDELQEQENLLSTVFYNGQLRQRVSLADVRVRAEKTTPS